MAKQILSEQFRRMQKLAGIITEEQLNEEQSNYSIELLVPKVYFNVETGELSGNKYEWYSERELRAGADQTSYANAEELDTVVFSNDYNTAMDFASEYPELLKVVSLNESQLNEEKIPFFHLDQILNLADLSKPKADQMADLKVGLIVLPKMAYKNEGDIKAQVGKITKIEGDKVTVEKVNGNEENRKVSDLVHLIDGGYRF
jgi:hypothetical protein